MKEWAVPILWIMVGKFGGRTDEIDRGTDELDGGGTVELDGGKTDVMSNGEEFKIEW